MKGSSNDLSESPNNDSSLSKFDGRRGGKKLNVTTDDDDSDNAEGSGGDTADKDQLCELYREAKQIEDMARGDIRGMQVWRMIVLLVILVTYAASTAWTFVYLHSEQADDTGERFDVFKTSMEVALERQFTVFRHSLSSLSQTVTAAAVARESGNGSLPETTTFPLVDVPLFEALAHDVRQSSRATMVAWHPLVQPDLIHRAQWNHHVRRHGIAWYETSMAMYLQESLPLEVDEEERRLQQETAEATSPTTLPADIWSFDQQDHELLLPWNSSNAESSLLAPLWYVSPPNLAPTMVNYNILSEEDAAALFDAMAQSRDGVTSSVNPQSSQLPMLFGQAGASDVLQSLFSPTKEEEAREKAEEEEADEELVVSPSFGHPHSIHFQPVFAKLNDRDSPMVGFISALVPWESFLVDLIPYNIENIIVVMQNTCNQTFTYRMAMGRQAEFLGAGDMHDAAFDESAFPIDLTTYELNATSETPGHCAYSLTLYMSADFTPEETTNLALLCSLALVVVFSIMVAVFFLFDRFVRKRNREAIDEAARSNAIVSSLFPAAVKERLFSQNDGADSKGVPSKRVKRKQSTAEFGSDESDFMYDSKPIADLFPETTILFADIVGFTAWASIREPTQVFILLETLYRAFDAIAKKRRIFKVETIGDCYVAVAGLPEPRKDHAIAMSRFANDCMTRMRVLTGKLEVVLGPDTGDLAMRMGLHSGPVTAGVLRGERGRFQLFGDTMNTAARMESNGMRDKIQISQETADLLVAAGKTSWVTKRADLIVAKGKGELQTYWLNVSCRNDAVSTVGTELSSTPSESAGVEESNADEIADARTNRLIDWSVEVLLKLLRQIEAQRVASDRSSGSTAPAPEPQYVPKAGLSKLDEIKEMISFPKGNGVGGAMVDLFSEEAGVLDPLVVQQLHVYVSTIAERYNSSNPFHNFEHASHVAMSVVKLLSRVVPVPAGATSDASVPAQNTVIASDPLTQFSCVLSALIHDVDHPGVPNNQLVQEESQMARRYEGKSVAEQNSLDLSWNLLNEERFAQLRRAIYQTNDELKRFRQLLVCSIMATDIMDAELKDVRNQNWDSVFTPNPSTAKRSMSINASLSNSSSTETLVNRKATIVIEHLIQASDVAHTMQHWHVYRKWNECLFRECYQAYRDGRSDKNPADGWYNGELWFFDNYILPLAQKLKDCGVFGVSSDEYLNYATQNRSEWETRGKAIVIEMVEKVQQSIIPSNTILEDEDPTEFTA